VAGALGPRIGRVTGRPSRRSVRVLAPARRPRRPEGWRTPGAPDSSRNQRQRAAKTTPPDTDRRSFPGGRRSRSRDPPAHFQGGRSSPKHGRRRPRCEDAIATFLWAAANVPPRVSRKDRQPGLASRSGAAAGIIVGMSAYVISEFEIHDESQGQRDRELAAASIAWHGGRYMVRGAQPEVPEVPEGDWPAAQRVVVVEFPTMDRLRSWYASSDYAEALAVQEKARPAGCSSSLASRRVKRPDPSTWAVRRGIGMRAIRRVGAEVIGARLRKVRPSRCDRPVDGGQGERRVLEAGGGVQLGDVVAFGCEEAQGEAPDGFDLDGPEVVDGLVSVDEVGGDGRRPGAQPEADGVGAEPSPGHAERLAALRRLSRRCKPDRGEGLVGPAPPAPGASRTARWSRGTLIVVGGAPDRMGSHGPDLVYRR